MRKKEYHVFVEGIPQPQARPRTGKYGNFYSPEPKNGWKETIQAYLLQQAGQIFTTGPVSLQIQFIFPKKSVPHGVMFEPHTQKPDIDNLEKVVLDALKGLVWKDDCQVFKVESEKCWACHKAGMELWITVYPKGETK